jgi:hypothetical protein
MGRITAPAALVFLALTCLPILVTPFVTYAGGGTPGWAVILPIGPFALATLAVLWKLLGPIGGPAAARA